MGYLGGTGLAHEFFNNDIHVVATNNTGYGFYAGDTATVSRFYYNHVHVTDVAGLSYAFYVGATATVSSVFDSVIAADGNDVDVAGFFEAVNSTADGSLTVTDLTNNAIALGGGTTPLKVVGPLTNGQLVIGSTGVAPVAAQIQPGMGIAITNGAGSITVSAWGGGVSWTVETVNLNFTANKGIIANKAGLLTVTLPATAAIGDVLEITGINTAVGWRVAQNALQRIHSGTASSTVGIGGYIESTEIRDYAKLLCVVAGASTEWNVVSRSGNLTVI
jgi:hypothetical protein